MGPMLLRSLAIVLAVIPSSLSLNVRRSEVNPVLPGAYIVEFEESATARSADVSKDRLVITLNIVLWRWC